MCIKIDEDNRDYLYKYRTEWYGGKMLELKHLDLCLGMSLTICGCGQVLPNDLSNLPEVL